MVDNARDHGSTDLCLALAALIPFILAACGSHPDDRANSDSNAQSISKSASESASKDRAWLTDETEAWGLDFHHRTHDRESYFMPDSLGSGAAFLDYNQDGLLDLYLIQNAGESSGFHNRLYRQTADRRFEDVSAGSGLDVEGLGMGAAVGDVNNDGWPDVLLTEYRAARLFLNRQGRGFQEAGPSSGLANPHWGASAAFLDYDRDGWLDVVIANYIDYAASHQCSDSNGVQEFCAPSGFRPAPSLLFRNLGADSGSPGAVRFKNVTLESGLLTQTGPSLGVFSADFNGDRWADILLANDGKPNLLWINQKNGRFREEASARGLALNAMGQPQANMGIAVGDVDGDGLFDVFITHLNNEYHALWKQDAPGLFMDESNRSGLTDLNRQGTAFGTCMADFNHDGAPDIVIANGSIDRQANPPGPADPDLEPFWRPYAQPNQILKNRGPGEFVEISENTPDFAGLARVGRGLAMGDVDNDGDMDLLATYIDAPARLFINRAPKEGNWLTLKLVLPSLGRRDAYGAVATISTDSRRFVQTLNPGQSYLCSHDPRLHFGLGKIDRVNAMEIDWPDGSQERFPASGVNRFIVIEKGRGEIITN